MDLCNKADDIPFSIMKVAAKNILEKEEKSIYLELNNLTTDYGHFFSEEDRDIIFFSSFNIKEYTPSTSEKKSKTKKDVQCLKQELFKRMDSFQEANLKLREIESRNPIFKYELVKDQAVKAQSLGINDLTLSEGKIGDVSFADIASETKKNIKKQKSFYE